METVSPPRISLVLSLVVLGVSVAGFATATGVAAPVTGGPAGEFAVEDGALTYETNGGSVTTVVDDVQRLERIEITQADGRLGVTTTALTPPELSDEQRDLARRIVMTDDAVTERLDGTTGATLTVVPLAEGERLEDRAALAELNPETGIAGRFESDSPTFRTSVEESTGTVRLEREGVRPVDDRAVVVVDPVGEPTEFRAVVDLRTETVEQLLRLEFVTERDA